MNWSRIIWRILVWTVGILRVALIPAVFAMLFLVVFHHWFTIVIFAIVVIGFPLAAHIESKR